MKRMSAIAMSIVGTVLFTPVSFAETTSTNSVTSPDTSVEAPWRRGHGDRRGRGDRFDRRDRRHGGGFWIGIGIGGRRNVWACTYAGRNRRGIRVSINSGAHYGRLSAQNRGYRRCLNNGLRGCYLVACSRY